MTITAAADGSALGNPGPAGWAWYVNDGCWAAGGWPHATNNQGELKAVLELFRATAHLDDDLLVLCDSQYVINSVTKWMPGWKKKGWRKSDGKPVLNVELLQEIDAELVGRKYRFEWVKGHANHPLNEAADVRARAVAEAFQRRSAIPTGPGWVRAGDPAARRPVVEGATHDDGRASSGATRSSATATGTATASGNGTGTATATATATRAKTEPRGSVSALPTHPELFSFDTADGAPSRADAYSVTIPLSAEEHARLVERARQRGVSVEALLRSWI